MRHLLYILIFAALLFSGCSTKKSYLLYNQQTPVKQVESPYTHTIGVKTIKIPQYLEHKSIPLMLQNHEIIYLAHKEWVSYLDEHLTNRIVNTLQLSLNTPKVCQYPENSPTKTDLILQITLHKYIATANSVILEASWSVENSDHTLSERFDTAVPITNQDDVIEGMNIAFGALENAIITSVISTK